MPLSPCPAVSSLLVFLILTLALPSVASGQAAGSPPLVSDRPDFTESPFVVPPGFVQFELGMTHQRESGSGITSVGEGLLRIPLSERVEARLGFPTLHVNGVSRVTDAAIGAKVELPAAPGGYDLGLIGTVSLPTGQAPLSAETIVPSIILATGGPLTEKLTLGAQIAGALPEGDGSRVLVSGATLVVSAPVGGRTSAFAEVAGEWVEFEDLYLLSHLGVAWLLDDSRQLDVHVGSALTNDAPDLFIGFGFVYRR